MIDSIGPRHIVPVPAGKPVSRDDPKKTPKEDTPKREKPRDSDDAGGRKGTIIDDRS